MFGGYGARSARPADPHRPPVSLLVTSSLQHDRDLEFPFQTARDLNELVEFLERAAVPEIMISCSHSGVGSFSDDIDVVGQVDLLQIDLAVEIESHPKNLAFLCARLFLAWIVHRSV